MKLQERGASKLTQDMLPKLSRLSFMALSYGQEMFIVAPAVEVIDVGGGAFKVVTKLDEVICKKNVDHQGKD